MSELLHYCQTAQGEGLSMRAALRLARSAGYSIRTDAFAKTWRAAKATSILNVNQGTKGKAA